MNIIQNKSLSLLNKKTNVEKNDQNKLELESLNQAIKYFRRKII